MDIDKTMKRHSGKKYKFSKNDLTLEKPILKELTTKDSCSDDEEIEFEGWVEFITKDDKCTDENDDYEKEPKITQEKRNSNIKSRRDSNKNNSSMNDQYPRYSYTSPSYFYEQPQNIIPLCNQTNYTNENKIVYPMYLSNTQEYPKGGMNVIKPNYIDPPSPIVLKNTQVLPQLYIRQPPTVIVTNESRPPLVINPPPANVILKNKAPQPIYVNSTRPNIIIKNDPPSTQNPINMDTTPIQLDAMPDNRENAINSSIKYPSIANIQTDVNILPNSIPTNVLHLENNTNGYMAPQNIPNIYMLNNNSAKPQVLYQNGLPVSTVNAINPDSPINNVIYEKGIFDFKNTVFNPVGLANSATIQPNYSQLLPQVFQTSTQFPQPIPQYCQASPQISQPTLQYYQVASQTSQPILQSCQATPQFSQPVLQSYQNIPQISSPLLQPCQNNNLLNQVTIPNSLLQVVPNQQVHQSIPQGVQSFPQSGVVHNVSQPHGLVQPQQYSVPQAMQYANPNYQMHNSVNLQPIGYEKEIQQYNYLNTSPQVINQNYMPSYTDMGLQMRNSVIPRNGSIVPNNIVQSEAHMGKYGSHPMNRNSANIPVMQNSYNSLENVATCGAIGCGTKQKTSPVTPLRRRSTYINLKQNFVRPPSKSVQIVSQPAINRNSRVYSTYR
ncbi:conserved Plasmodium protein, unknown function [Plasmodium vinckei vinckei]|uniref:Pv-fam-g protein n=1 Tax=Plasmodium vinckei vinckei TaxID=54757 RepID=A0A449BXT7_PLAVN|nr:conserved Plasmodium protein, unknown function [Plasmodium vinckei vinckei]KEG04617.1 hypothetical protein YYE_00192 [Plasmodium vinckei vinckei]VEV58268.1 conserved Plasmodium protein, unknown function [Plasmodium vinckei vinckei]